jgi:shikimate dehydrogenase
MTETDRYAVFGNPIRHSKSPQIHVEFASQCEQSLQYRAVFVELDRFSDTVTRFFENGGRGANVTLPFKREAWELAEVLSERARRAGAVNTLSLDADGKLVGDNTDGIGLVRDMIANLGWAIRDTRVLLLGAGGAARGVVELLLRESPESLHIVNRTASRAAQLAGEFADLGPVTGGGYELLKGAGFDLVINATSASLGGELPPLPDSLLTERSCCYDMMYAAEPTVFMRWAAQNAAWAVSDGLGMLVEQAAESFYIWRGRRPQTGTVIAGLRAGQEGA